MESEVNKTSKIIEYENKSQTKNGFYEAEGTHSDCSAFSTDTHLDSMFVTGGRVGSRFTIGENCIIFVMQFVGDYLLCEDLTSLQC